MSKTIHLPVRNIARNLRYHNERIRAYGFTDPNADVRLQVYPDGRWAIRVGDEQYDTDHRGVWGSDMLPLTARFDSMAMARSLINQAVDMAVDGGLDDGIKLTYARKVDKMYQGHKNRNASKAEGNEP